MMRLPISANGITSKHKHDSKTYNVAIDSQKGADENNDKKNYCTVYCDYAAGFR